MHNVLKYQIGTIADLEEDINYLMINPTTLSRQKKKKKEKKKKKKTCVQWILCCPTTVLTPGR